MTGYLKRAWDWYWSLSFPLKVLTTAVISSVGGGTYVAIISEASAYYYALYFGFRLPFEGIPYLRVTVVALATVLSGSVALVVLFAWYFSETLGRVGSSVLSARAKSYSPFSGIVRNSKLLFFYALTVYLILKIANEVMMYLHYGSIYQLFDERPSYSIIIISSLFFGVTILSLLWASFTVLRYLFVFFLMIVVLMVPFFLFIPEVYANFLRFLRYGGGYQVNVWTGDNEQSAYIWYLLLRTSDVLVLYNPEEHGIADGKGGDIQELPLSRVSYFGYDHDAAATYQLPPPVR